MRVRWWRLGGSGGRRMIFIPLSQGEDRGEGEASFPPILLAVDEVFGFEDIYA